MELNDCALPLLHCKWLKLKTISSQHHFNNFSAITPTTDEAEGFRDIDAAFLVGAMPRKEGMERKDLLAANVRIFKSQGAALDKFAKKTVKVRGLDRLVR